MHTLSPQPPVPPSGNGKSEPSAAPGPVPEARKGGPGKVIVAVAILIIFAAGGLAGFYVGSLKTKEPSKAPELPVDTAVHPTAWARIDTSYGVIVVGLYGNETPKTTGNFINLTNLGFYTRTTFHRVVAGFVMQGGGYDENMTLMAVPFPPIKLEISPKLNNTRGTLAMARTNDPDSATTQFFINLVDNRAMLDPGGTGREGYAVFGIVLKGMDVVDTIATAPVIDPGYGERSRPDPPVMIYSITMVPAPVG